LIVVESAVVLLVASVILINFLVDIAYALVDPRLQSEQS
jgi:peptide/nickel transport system permease protein